MLEQSTAGEVVQEDEYTHFWVEGEPAKGEFHCAECGYGVIVHSTLPVCPMCSATSWEQSAWSPFGRARVSAGL